MKFITRIGGRRHCFLRAMVLLAAIVTASTFACSGSDPAAPVVPPSADCIDYSAYIHSAGSLQTDLTWITNVVVHEGLAYVVGDHLSKRRLEIFDLSAPDNPAMIGSVETGGFPEELIVVDSRAYVAASGGLQVIDVSEPTAPATIANLALGSILSVAPTDTFALVTRYTNFKYTTDVVDPTTPAQQAIVASLGDIARIVRVSGQLAVTAGPDLNVIDVSNPRHPVIVGHEDLPGSVADMVVSGRYAYLANHNSSLHVVDLTTPSHPALVGTASSVGWGLAVSWPFAYLTCRGSTDYESALCVVDVSDPSNIGMVWKVNTPGYIYGVSVASSRAYVASGGEGVQMINISTASANAITARASTAGLARDIAVVGPRAYVAESSRGLTVFDVSEGRARQIQSIDTPGSAVKVAVSGWHAFVADAGSGLQVVALSTGLIVGSVDTPGRALAVALDGSLAFLADGEAGVQVIDVSARARPMSVGSVATEGSANDIEVAEGRAYVATGPAAGAGLSIVDITTPASPRVIGMVRTRVAATNIAVFGLYACVTGANTDGQSSFYVTDIGNANAPVIAGELILEGYAGDIALDGRLAYVAGGSSDGGTCVWVVDISNPAMPTLVGCMQRLLPNETANGVGIYGHGVALSENRAFVVGADLVVFPLQCQ